MVLMEHIINHLDSKREWQDIHVLMYIKYMFYCKYYVCYFLFVHNLRFHFIINNEI